MGSTRRQFISGDFSAKNVAIRPPWAVAKGFEIFCSRCGDCVEACEEAIITTERSGFPQIDFSRGECSFCRACVESCRYEALDNSSSQSRKYRELAYPWRAKIDESCLQVKGVTCLACMDQCQYDAIILGDPARSRISIKQPKCVGCGACIGACPENSIKPDFEYLKSPIRNVQQQEIKSCM